MEVQEGRREAMLPNGARTPLTNMRAASGRPRRSRSIAKKATSAQTSSQRNAVGELEAVENAYAVVEAEDIRGLQVAVAITDVPICDSGLQECTV